jgi:acetolactate synthase-1/2/3 large subunit
MNAARLAVECLKKLGVKRVYGIIGTSVLDFIDALYDADIRYISCRHEQVAASMADAEGRITGFPGVAVVHAGPGTLNAMISVANAYKDGSPMILIAGGVKRKLFGKNSWLEVDQQRVLEPITVATFRIENASDVSGTLGKAFSIAIEKCGPVFIEVAEDVWPEESNAGIEECRIITVRRVAKDDDVKKAAEIVRRAKRPLIIAGYGVNCDAGSELLTMLVEKTGIPVATTGGGRGAISEEHPLCLGRVGFGGGTIHADRALENSDCVLCLGCQLSDITSYGYNVMPKGDVMAVTLDEEAEEKLDYTFISISDAIDFLKKLISYLEGYRTPEEWVNEIDGWRKTWEAMVENGAKMKYEGYANPALFFKRLSERMGDVALVAGQGMHVLYSYAYLKVRRPRYFLAATNLGAMGFGLPAAMVSALHRPTIAVLGDGEFMMTVQDLETAVREKIPVKIVVVNDNSYRVLYMRQKVQKMGRIYGTLHSNPDFAELARVFGADGVKVDCDERIDDAIEKMLNAEKPFVVDLVITPDCFAPFNFEASAKM